MKATHNIWMWGTALLGLLLSIVLFQLFSSREKQLTEVEFQKISQSYATFFKRELELHLEVLSQLRAFYRSSEYVSREEFKTFTKDSLHKYKSIQALEWIPAIEHQERNLYEQRARENGFNGFHIRESKQGVMTTAQERPIYYPVYYVEPVEGNEKAIGFDLGSNPTRLEALLKAQKENKPVATSRITLVQETEKQFGFLLFIPIYHPKDNTFKGFVLGVFRIGSLLSEVMKKLSPHKVHITLCDKVVDSTEPLGAFSFDPSLGEANLSAPYLYKESIQVADRSWVFKVIPTHEYITEHSKSLPWVIFSTCLFFTLCICFLIFNINAQKAEVERLIVKRTKELNHQKQRAEEASKTKSDFLANMSYELRTPLNSIHIFSQILSHNDDKNLSPEQVQYAELIQKSGEELLCLINDILDISKIESGKMNLDPSRFETQRLAKETLNNFIGIGSQKDIKIHHHIDEDFPKEIKADFLKLGQIIKNLLSNAVKFTDKGDVTLSFKTEHPTFPSHHHYLFISVKDSGIGISKASQELIFEAFAQADMGLDRKYGGTGLGLAISRSIAHRMGGQISLESQEGVGSEFVFLIERGKLT